MLRVIILSLCGFVALPATAQLAGDAKSIGEDSFAVGSLCLQGSFSCEAAPALTALIVQRHLLARAVRDHRVSVDEALSRLQVEDQARAAIDAALAACGGDERTGRCASPLARSQAQVLLSKAKFLLASAGSNPMTAQSARVLAAALIAAAEKAEAAGNDSIDLIASLQAADDSARAELIAAIQAAKAS